MKNKVIELERFLAACMVLLYHMGVAKAGWIFVEFFFILTGCFLMQHLESHKSDIEQNAVWYPLQYTWRKYWKLLPFTSASVIAMWVIYAAVNPFRSAQRVYIRYSIFAQSHDSVPPAPACRVTIALSLSYSPERSV